MNYTLNQLQIFLKVSQNESITKAAVELNLTQPAVSIQLKNFQDQFDIPLTEVVGRKLFVTDFGKEIAIAAENILNQVYAINYKTLAYRGQLSGRLKISIVSTGKYVMPYFLADFLQLHTGIELVLDVTNRGKVMESLEKNEVDFSLVSVLSENMQLESLELMPNKLYMVCSTQQKIVMEQYHHTILEEIPLIFREQGSATRMVMEKFIERNQIRIGKKIEMTSNEAVKQAIIAGLGCSLMPLIGIKNELNNGDLQIIPLKGLPIISNWHLVWLKSKNFSPAAAAYLQHIALEKSIIVDNKFGWIKTY